MKRMKKKIAGFLTAFLCAALVLPATGAKAAEVPEKSAHEYTVTFRAGNVGTFATSDFAGNDKIEVKDNYIKVKVAKGETVASVAGETWKDDNTFNTWLKSNVDIKKNADGMPVYAVKDLTDTEGVVTASIKRNTEYVLDYGRLVDPVSYTVLYVDSQSGEQIATPAIVYANAGDEITVYPKGMENYTVSEEKQNLKLEKDAENTVTFHYTYSGEVETITTTVTNRVPGSTTTVEEVNEIRQTVQTAGEGTNNGQQTAGNGAVRDQGNGRTDNTANNNTPADNNTPDEDNAPADNTTDIQEEETPLGDGTDQNNEEETPSAEDESGNAGKQIEEEEVPLGSGTEEASSGAVVIPMIGGVLAALLVVIAVFVISRKKKAASGNGKSKK